LHWIITPARPDQGIMFSLIKVLGLEICTFSPYGYPGPEESLAMLLIMEFGLLQENINLMIWIMEDMDIGLIISV
jgi:hypothetical protein